MRHTRAAAAAAAFLLLFGACSDPQGTEPGDAAATAAGEDAEDPGDGGDGATPGDKGTDGPGGPGKSSGGGSGSGSGGGSGGRGGSGGSGGGGGSGSGSGGGGPATAYPGEGEYVYAQKGFERFCQGPSCNKEPLPDTQTIVATYAARSADSATVVTEAHPSEEQTMTTTTRYTADAALITKVDIDFSYGGFGFSQTYEPRPPVRSLQLPLEVGKRWRGRWDARTSGDYRIAVVDKGTFGGVETYKLVTVTNFRGDFTGRAQATVWIDAATWMPVRTDGQIAVASSFGEYSSDFETTLRSGPGY